MSVLSLDPATRTGFAVLRDDAEIDSGVWILRADKYAPLGALYARLEKKLADCFAEYGITEVVFEEVRNHIGTDAAHMYGGISAFILCACEKAKIKVSTLEVGRIKKHATTFGNAKKEQMIAAARAKWTDRNILDDNEADALWILDLYLKTKK